MFLVSLKTKFYNSHFSINFFKFQGNFNVDKENEDNPFELFVAATNIRYCYYKETHKILGNTYGRKMLKCFLKVVFELCNIIFIFQACASSRISRP